MRRRIAGLVCGNRPGRVPAAGNRGIGLRPMRDCGWSRGGDAADATADELPDAIEGPEYAAPTDADFGDIVCATSDAIVADAAGSAGDDLGSAVGRGARGTKPLLHGNSFAAGTASFAAETAVLMGDGTRRPIETVRAGERVESTDMATGKTAARDVVA